MTNIQLVRVYLSESEDHLNSVLKILHDEVKIKHAVVFRGIEGFEKGGKVHTSQFLSLSLDLPLVVEFFDTPEQVEKAVALIQAAVDKGHILKLDGHIVVQ